MKLKFVAGFILLCVALILQFWFTSAGVFMDLSFAALITFALVFDFWPLLVLILLAVFVLNWQPGFNPELLVIGLFPIAAYICKNLVAWERWIENLGGIALGFIILYLVADRSAFSPISFIIDLAGSLLFGALIFSFLYHWDHHHA